MIEVVIPAHNAALYLRETLLSVAAQSHLPSQVTIVNDASTDGTLEVADACARELRSVIPIRTLSNEGARGPSGARNTGIRHSRADWIALLDADDLLAPLHHETLLRLASASPGTALAFGNSTLFDDATTVVPNYLEASGVLGSPAKMVEKDCWSLGDNMFVSLLRSGVFGTSACLFRREAGLNAGLFNEAMWQGEDTDFFIRLCFQGLFVFSKDVITHKRVHDKNLSHPRHKIAFLNSRCQSLGRFEGSSSELSLTAQQRVELSSALTETFWGYLYTASLSSASDYFNATSIAWRTGRKGVALHPRNIMRFLLRHWIRNRHSNLELPNSSD